MKAFIITYKMKKREKRDLLFYKAWCEAGNALCEYERVKEKLNEIVFQSGIESFKYHSMCARATLFPGKTIEEVKAILESFNGIIDS